VSLAQRHAARKFRPHEDGNTRHVLFANPPKPRLAMVSYGAAERLVVFDLRDDTQAFRAFAASRVVGLVESIRDGAAARLIAGFPERRADVEAVVIGRQGEGAPRLPIEQRTRIIPLPSVGHEHADHAIRRFALQLPFGSPLAADDIEWALAGLTLQSPAGTMVQVTRAQDHTMLGRYTLASARWRSVTAVVLPDDARRRRIAPERQREEGKGGAERAREEALAVRAVHSALRHAGVRAVAIGVRVQREPFTSRGSRVEAFAEGTRFTKERLWHVEIELDREVPGPLVIGDGRFLGLGVMLPHRVGD
jgi:CRISPR-associated protein Csb2